MSTFNGFANSLMLTADELVEGGVNFEDYELLPEVMREGANEITRLQAELETLKSMQVRDANLVREHCAGLQAQLDEAQEKLSKVVHCISDLIDNSEGVYGLHLNGDPSPWNSLLQGGRDEAWMIDFSEVAYTKVPDTDKQEVKR
jgi:hypothetical protein